jgi:Cu+-exporting ATPase
MLTGDNQTTATAFAKKVGINQVIANVLPTEKYQIITALQKNGHHILMVGDGINDSPALKIANIGVAIGSGTDIAIETADIVLIKNSLTDLVTAIKLSHRTVRNIKRGLFWAFIYNLLGIPLAAGILYPFLHLTLNPMIAASAMSLSSICVVINALTLQR